MDKLKDLIFKIKKNIAVSVSVAVYNAIISGDLNILCFNGYLSLS